MSSSTTTRPAPRRTARRVPPPTLRLERSLLRSGHVLVAGMDEVGRGSLAGPVSVGVTIVDLSTRTSPSGLRDSKDLNPAVRERLVPRLRRWALASAVGHAEPEEIDRYGIIAALRLAGRRALAELPELPTMIVLDGKHNWFALPGAAGPAVQLLGEQQQFELIDLPALEGVTPDRFVREAPALPELAHEPEVTMLIKADRKCSSVAAASVLAKVERDAIMVHRSQQHPAYGWAGNKGYSAPEHFEALRTVGPCAQHRLSWNITVEQGKMVADLNSVIDTERQAR